ncbi:AsmA-like C-terminal region-containing protein [Shimia sp.]|uniref:AsmA-like C-terminal region-containing protein n=1 Tax=Shimia sp. TaxID=1954381 RepID=UPI00329A722B
MSKTIITVGKWITILVIVLAAIAWLVLASPVFSSVRKSMVETLLSNQIGQAFEISGDVRITPRRIARLHISEAQIPSTTIDGVILAELGLLELDLDLPAILAGRIGLDNLVIDGLQTKLITTQDGTTSWVKSQATPDKPEAETEKGEENEGSILTFLSTKTITFTNLGLLIENQTSGFTFDFALGNAQLEQQEGGQLATFKGKGTVNEEEFELTGNYPRDAPFTHNVSFGQIELTFNGETIPETEGGGYFAQLELDTGEIGEIFDIFGLKRSIEGNGDLSARITRQQGLLAVEGLSSRFDLSEGQEINISGDIGNVHTRENVDVRIDARLHPEGAPPAKAESLKDLKLAGINTRIVSDADGLEFDELIILTNAFEQGLDRVGPITIGKLYRSPDETLGVREITLQVGPLEDPYVTAAGSVGDVFKFKDVSFDGTLSGPSSLLLKALSEEDAARFGRVSAEFAISDASGALGLEQLSARAEDTDLWSFEADVSAEDVAKLGKVIASLNFGISDPETFLTALQVDPVKVGALDLALDVKTEGPDIDFAAAFKAGGSDISTNVSFDLSQDINVIRGAIESGRMQLADIRDGTKAIVAISKSNDARKSEEPEEKAEEPAPDDGKPPLQPLVLKDEEQGLLSPKRILTKTDLDISVELKEFVGDKGVSSMSSRLVADQGQIEAGPMELHYGNGFFKVHADMDAVNNPELLNIDGATSGWDFGNILDAVGLGIQASGTLGASFDVSGNITSGKQFARSLAGSASVNMGNGKIATSLLELAGLGVFPWLFSQERSAGETEIVCVRAPVRINAGRVGFDQVVVETRSVQLVARGEVNWVGDTISVRAEPRRVGKPLSRSAWPISVSGKLSDPKFKPDVGGSRSKRADGADQMPDDRKPCVPDIFQLE